MDDWKLAGESNKAFIFVNVKSVVKQGEYRKAWTLWEYKEPRQTSDYKKSSYNSEKSLTYVDCGTKRTATTQNIRYADSLGSGEVVTTESLKFFPTMLDDVAPGTIGEAVLEYACSIPLKRK